MLGAVLLVGGFVAVKTVFGGLSSQSVFPALNRHAVGDGFVCNDGTPAVYFLRKSTDPKENRWILRFEGGGNCATFETCASRWATRSKDMTTLWQEQLWLDEEGGALCADPELNSRYYNWNHIYAHYCSSDSWMGTVALNDPDNELDWAFLGNKIMNEILEQALSQHGMDKASVILTTGMSVGAEGVYNYVDRHYDLYKKRAPDAEAYFVADAGWMLYNWNFGMSEIGTQGKDQFYAHKPSMDENCLAAGYTWECYYPADFQCVL
jgi:hypothetical protein